MIYKGFYLFCGIGGGALGFQQARQEYKGLLGQFRTLAGVDCDPQACEDFERLTGAPGVQMDLFSRRDYELFHGQKPPEDWREAEPWDLYLAAGREYPNVVFLSPPCKGYSGLLPSASAASAKYQALNRLVPRSARLTCEAFEEDLPEALLIENVPRITSRGASLLSEVKQLLKRYGYVFHEGTHDCGEIAGLGQRRKRYLLIARNEKKMPSFIYRPALQKVKTIGDIIGPMPTPDNPVSGPLHRLPNLQWKTWVRLALIPAGGDWRDLQNIDPSKYRIEHEPRKSTFGVMDWDEHAGTVTGNMRPGGSTAAAIVDPRMNLNSGTTHKAIYKVSRFDETANTVTGSHGPNNGAIVIPDPRLQACEGKHAAVYRVVKFDEPGPCVTGTRLGSGVPAIADPRFPDRENRRSNGYIVRPWDAAAHTITGEDTLGSGAQSIADPRFGCTARAGTMAVQAWEDTGKTVTGTGDIHSGAAAVADPRVPADTESGSWVLIAEDGTWHRPLTTLELAALQGFPLYMADGKPLTLAGKSDARWREAIGNAVPPPAARVIGEQILTALMMSEKGDFFTLTCSGVWVKKESAVSEAIL